MDMTGTAEDMAAVQLPASIAALARKPKRQHTACGFVDKARKEDCCEISGSHGGDYEL
jgi:hypothetical protein